MSEMEETYDFTMTGTLEGRVVALRWNDGILSGDPIALARLRELAARWDGHEVGIMEYWSSTHNHLSCPVGTVWLMGQLLGPKAVVSGNYVMAPRRDPGWE